MLSIIMDQEATREDYNIHESNILIYFDKKKKLLSVFLKILHCI